MFSDWHNATDFGRTFISPQKKYDNGILFQAPDILRTVHAVSNNDSQLAGNSGEKNLRIRSDMVPGFPTGGEAGRKKEYRQKRYPDSLRKFLLKRSGDI